MTHIRDGIQSGEALGRIKAPVLVRHCEVIIYRAGHRRARIAQAMVPDDLAMILDELLDVERGRVGAFGGRRRQNIRVEIEVKA